jgi:hypothetical protein
MFAIHSVLLFVVGDHPINAQRSKAFPIQRRASVCTQ